MLLLLLRFVLRSFTLARLFAIAAYASDGLTHGFVVFRVTRTLSAQLQLQTGRAGVVAARLEKMTAWDTESVFANIVRFPNYGIPGPNTSESYGAWRTTRYLLRAPGESESRRQVRVAPERKRKRGEKRNSMVAVRENGNVSHQPGQGMRGDGAARLLREYSRQRFMDLLRSCSPITKDCMNEFVSLIMPAGFQAGTARKRLNATRRSTPRSGSESRSLFLLEDQRGPSVPKKQKPPPQPQQPQPLRPQQARSEQPRPQQPRPQQPRRQQQQQPQQQPQQHQHNQQTQQRPVQSKKGSGKQARSSTAHKNGLAFESFADGIDRGIVYRSIIQSRPTPESLEGGDDSDSKEEVIDEIWRLELGDKQLSEFLDTSALEKMYMNLWNKYVSHEVYVFADRYVLDVVVQFALKYGTLLSALHLEVIFVRHLGELCSRGLLDAKGMHEAVVTLGKAKESPRAEQNLTRLRSNFPFYTRVLRRAKGAQRRRGVPPAPPRQMEPPSVQTCCGSGESPDPEQVIVLD